MKTKMKVTLAFVPLVVAASLMYSGYQKNVNERFQTIEC